MNEFIEGFLLQASLILALGAQNIFVLESGLKKQRQFLVASICSTCDTILVMAGVLGAATIFVWYPSLKFFFGASGVLFLFFYGAKKLQGALTPNHTQEAVEIKIVSTQQTALLSLSFSLLNPHVYLDTVVLIGSYAAKFPELLERASFGAGASAFSITWFFGLTFFAQRMSKMFNNQKSMRVVYFISGVILLGLSLKLGQDVYSWLPK